MERRLAAILVADVVGYARLIEADEAGTLAALKARRRSVLEPLLAKYRGHLVKLMGDGALVEFASAVNAVQCAIELQEEMDKANSGLAPDKAIVLRIGINLGDVVVEGSDLYGDGVNIAARLEAMAEPGGICISGSIHEQVKGKMKLAFEDMGRQSVKNIGEPVQVFRLGQSLGFKHSSPSREPLPLPEKPSVAVLPFANMSDDPAQDYFADGVVEEITSALSRVRSLFVIARNSAFVYKARPASAQQIGRELGVRYLIEGSVRKAGERVRITAQLIDAATQNHLWADRYEGALSDIFDLQDRFTESVVGAIQPSILAAEIERARRKRPESLVAHDYVLRAFPMVWSFSEHQNDSAMALLDRAISIEPTYALALSLSAWCHAQRAVYNWTDRLGEAREAALHLAAARCSHQ